MYRFGILSTASIAPRVIDAIRKTGNEVTTIASRDKDKAMKFAKEHHISKYYGTYEEIYEDKDVDILYIPVINISHYDCASKALRHKKHVLLEKPFTMSEKEAEDLFEIAKENNCLLMEGVKNVFMPSTEFVKENLPLIGKIISISTKQGTKKPFSKDHWMYKKEMGGGAYIGSCAYCYHILLNIFNGHINDVKAKLTPSHLTSDKCALFTYKINEIPVKSIIDMENDADNLMIINGEKGKIVIDTFWRSHNVKIYEKDKLIKEFKDEGNEFVYEINHFINCLKENKTTSDIVTASKTIEVVSLIEEVLKTN